MAQFLITKIVLPKVVAAIKKHQEQFINETLSCVLNHTNEFLKIKGKSPIDPNIWATNTNEFKTELNSTVTSILDELNNLNSLITGGVKSIIDKILTIITKAVTSMRQFLIFKQFISDNIQGLSIKELFESFFPITEKGKNIFNPIQIKNGKFMRCMITIIVNIAGKEIPPEIKNQLTNFLEPIMKGVNEVATGTSDALSLANTTRQMFGKAKGEGGNITLVSSGWLGTSQCQYFLIAIAILIILFFVFVHEYRKNQKTTPFVDQPMRVFL